MRLPDRLREHAEVAAYLVASDALTNVQKHAGATTASLRASVQDHDQLVVEVSDDGRGGATETRGSGRPPAARVP